jgi:hypothetical protein
VHGLEVLVGLSLRIVVAVEGVRVLGAVRLGAGQVHRWEAEALGQAEDRLVAAVDQLAAELGALPVGPVAGELDEVGVHAAADARRVGLVHGREDPLVLQRQRGGKAGDASADDRDARLRGGAGGSRERRGAGQRNGRADGSRPEELLARVRPPGLAFPQLVDRDVQRLGGRMLAGQPANCAQQRCPRHHQLPLLGCRRASRSCRRVVKPSQTMLRTALG